MKIKKTKGEPNDPRPTVTIQTKDFTLEVCGYDMLPHLIRGKSYRRLDWETFRQLLLGRIKVDEIT